MDIRKVKIKRVKEGEESSKMIYPDDFVHSVVPADGFMIYVDQHNPMKLYIRDTDIDKAMNMHKVDDSVSFEAESWGDGNE